MRGQITVYYDLPKLAIYLERFGNRVTEQQVERLIADMLKQAVALHMNEEADTISGTLMEMFSTTDGTHTFENLPTDALHVYFGVDKKELSAISKEAKQRTTKYLQQSACEDAASKKELVMTYHTNIENLLLRKKNKEKIRKIFDEVYSNLYEHMQNNDAHMIAPEKNAKIIFLDFDGVLTNNNYSARLFEEGKPTSDKYGELFDPKAVDLLNHIIDDTDAKVVVSSSWRYLGLAKLQELWQERGLHGQVIDMTSLHAVDEFIMENGLEWLENGVEGNEMSSPRSMEIEHWLRYRKGNIANYVILDDLPMPTTLQAHFVQVNPVYGLLAPQTEQAINILNLK